MANMHVHARDIISPIRALEKYFQEGGTSIVRAAFAHSYFVHPDHVQERTPWFPDRVRTSRKHYPGHSRASRSTWVGDGRPVTLGDNGYAQQAWAQYTGRRLKRGSGYSVRHVWGHPWDPDAFTAGWNLCYMPFWAGALTEEQYPHPELQKAIRQASWDVYFRRKPVCPAPDFVRDQDMDLDGLLGDQPLLVLRREAPTHSGQPRTPACRLQPIVQDLMQTLLEDHSTLLGETERDDLMNTEYCIHTLRLSLGGFPLLRHRAEGRKINGHARYYRKPYGGRYYVCSQWWKDHHGDNAASLLAFVAELANRKPNHPGWPALEGHKATLAAYLGK